MRNGAESVGELRERCRGTFAPVARVIEGGPDGPDELFELLRRPGGECVLLESVEKREETGRYSFVASDPASRLVLRRGRAVEERGFGSVDRGPSLLRALEQAAVLPGCAPDPGMPPFAAGAVGFLSYDAVRHFEKVPDRHSREGAMPDALFLLFNAVYAFDHLRGELLALTALDGRDPGMEEENARRAHARLDRLESRLREPAGARPPEPRGAGPILRCAPPEDFLQAVSKAKEEILEGEVYQVVLSRRWEGAPGVAPLEVYRALRELNPSPYMYYLETREGTVLGASPEMLVRSRGRRVETRPIAGTVPRGEGPAEDEALAARLLSDPKERSEHVMLVDLARNDLGRVCEIGTVSVPRYADVERYSHVQHLVSEVRGELAAGRSSTDALGACFPAGTLTGAPKIRAMELIDALETSRRGIYGGAVGYLDCTGNLDMAIAIRTAVVQDGVFTIQAGAGIVADSVPEKELEETEAKAAAVFEAIQLAQDAVRAPRFPIPDSRLPTP